PGGRAAALAAGAAGFLDKPLPGVAGLRDLVLRHLGLRVPAPATEAGLPPPDPLALRDDLERAARLLDGAPGAGAQRYLAQFIAGLARSARDDALAEAAGRMTRDAGAVPAVAALLARRLRAAPAAFDRGL
ncbi:MAG: response regulator, partial [Gemmobacter sp.]